MEVLVEYDYAAQNIDELTINKGDRIKNVIRKEEGWYEGELIGSNGKRGLFPDNFVKPIKIPPANILGKPLPYSANLIKSPDDNRKKKILNGKLQQQQPPQMIVVPSTSPPPPPPPSIIQQQPPLPIPKPPKQQLSPATSNNYFKARVLYSYIPVNEDELAIQENEIVQVIRLVEDGWYEGIYAGKQGVFPSNYVEKIISTGEPSSLPPPPPPALVIVQQQQSLNQSLSNESINNSSLIENPDSNDEKKKNKKVMGIGFGNIFSGKTIELKTKEMNNKNIYSNGKHTALADEPAEITAKQKPVQNKKLKAKVLYEYLPTQPDELKLTCGELIYILDKNLEDEGWWRGESILTGDVGVFPDNFVEEIAESEITSPQLSMSQTPPPVVHNNTTNNSNVNNLKKKLNFSQQDNVIEANLSSLTNSVSSNSSSNNSLSKSSINNGVMQTAPAPLAPSPVVVNGSKTTNLVITSSFEENNSKSQSDLSEDLEDFNNESNKLTHIKKTTKQQNKRPPSFRVKNKVIDTEESKPEIPTSKPLLNNTSTMNINKEETAMTPQSQSPLHMHSARQHQDRDLSRQQTPTSPSKSSPISFNQLHANNHHSNNQSNSNYFNSAGGASSSSSSGINLTNGHHSSSSSNCISQQSLIDEISYLKEELDSIKKNSSQIQNDYKSVQIELVDLKKVHDEQMKKMQRKLVDLIGEIDEEKKTRLALQVELERLKKTIMNY